MSNRKLALVLSFVFPGMGQVCKGEVLKGFSFTAICILLIVSVFFFSAPTYLYRSGLAVILLMWFVGILDVYADYEFVTRRKQWLLWQRGLIILPIAATAAAIVILIMLWTLHLSARDWRMFTSTTVEGTADSSKPDDDQEYGRDENELKVQPDDAEYFSIQVGAFKDQKKAEEVCQGLLGKGYKVRVEQEAVADVIWYRILIGKFPTEQDAVEFRKELQEREGFTDMIVRRCSMGNEPNDLP